MHKSPTQPLTFGVAAQAAFGQSAAAKREEIEVRAWAKRETRKNVLTALGVVALLALGAFLGFSL